MAEAELTVDELEAQLKEHGTVPGGYRFEPHARIRWTKSDGTPVKGQDEQSTQRRGGRSQQSPSEES